MKSDIEIAQEAELVHIKEVAEKLGINEDELEFYGKYKAKISDELWESVKDREDGKLVLVTAITRHLPAKERPQQVSDLVRRWLYLVKKRYLHFVSRL